MHVCVYRDPPSMQDGRAGIVIDSDGQPYAHLRKCIITTFICDIRPMERLTHSLAQPVYI